MSVPTPVQRTALQLYRDCLRLIRHIAPGHSPKSMALTTMVQTEFRKGMDEEDPEKVEGMKAGAVRALSNYMLYESGSRDEKISKAMDRNLKESKASMASMTAAEKDINKNQTN